MSYTNGLDKPTDYFNTVLWTGDGTDDRNITGVGFQPDMVWEKKRSEAGSHRIADSIRGVTNVLFPDLTNAETSRPNEFQSFISDGFQIGSDDNFNGSSKTYVGWSWLAGTAFSNDASATGVGSIDSSGSINTTAGFSIISWTGSGSAATIAHGLGSKLSMYIVRNRTDVEDWIVYHGANTSAPETDYLQLNANNATGDSSGVWNDTAPTSSVFSVGTANSTNGSSDNMIAYCFAEKKGYSKFGSYTGNANADGTFIYTGFKPAWFMVKNTAASEHWRIYDNKRDSFNHMFRCIFPNQNSAESTVDNASEEIDFLSNGVKIRSNAQQLNGSGQTLIYAAFAESPFVTSTGIPTTAR